MYLKVNKTCSFVLKTLTGTRFVIFVDQTNSRSNSRCLLVVQIFLLKMWNILAPQQNARIFNTLKAPNQYF